MSFEILANFRDLGNYKNKDGLKIKSKKLLRSGELYNISENDINLLENEYNLQKIIDLRTDREVNDYPSVVIPNMEYIRLNIFSVIEDENSFSKKEMTEAYDKSNPQEKLKMGYYLLVNNKNANKCFSEFLNIISENETGSVLWHCFAGKDRTGFATFLVLYILGCSEDVIYEDYLLTNEMRKTHNEKLIEKAISEGADNEKVESMKIMLNVHKDYLDYAISEIENNFGSTEDYILNVLNFGKEKQELLREKYLEK